MTIDLRLKGSVQNEIVKVHIKANNAGIAAAPNKCALPKLSDFGKNALS